LSPLIIRRPSLIYHYHHSRYSQNYQQPFYFHTKRHSYRSHRVHECSNVNLSDMDSSSSNHRDQGVHVDSQSGFSDLHSGVGNEREVDQGGRDVDHTHHFSRETRRDAGSQTLASSSSAATSDSKSETFMSPYGGYDMDDSSFFAHTTRLNIIGPNLNFTQFPGRRSPSMERLLNRHGEKSMDRAFHKRTRFSRSPSPPPVPVPEKRTSPTESYLQQAFQRSLPLEDPTASRKLLVLDLNGTLLLRSTHSGRRAPLPYSPIHHFNNLPALRTVYPRPYLPSFCAYLFHPTTLQWLDTMVWSSAQPHSVNDMVDKCFGTYKEGLKAIWARDTLGLSNDEYREYTIYAGFIFAEMKTSLTNQLVTL
jgi:NLI interacting factor-like phosphatase